MEVFNKNYLLIMSENALYIAFEGIDGSGKSTQINGVSELLKTPSPKGPTKANDWYGGIA